MLNIKKVTYLKIGYFLLPSAVFVYDLIYVYGEFRFAVTAILCVFLALPLSIAIMRAVFSTQFEVTLFDYAPEFFDFLSPFFVFCLFSLILFVGYIQWFIVVPKLWHLIFGLNFWPFNVINPESTSVWVIAFCLVIILFVYMWFSGVFIYN